MINFKYISKHILVSLLIVQVGFTQNFTEYQTGSTTDVLTNHEFGICMMGGASEQEDAMIWFLNKANGGDVVVLRASGSDGYNDYFYSDLASDLNVPINSVTTFVIHNSSGASDPYVLQRVADAEAIWFAGGDQYDYVSYFKDNEMEVTLNEFVNQKQGVIGGTSAGLAILGSAYFSAQNGTVTNAEALANPYHPRVTIGANDFLNIPFLNNVITDSHYDDPDRRARHAVFLARIATDYDTRPFGIACNEYTAVCVEADGKAFVYGEFPVYEEFAYFLQANCTVLYQPENCEPNTPLTWNRDSQAIKVFKVPGTESGANYFDLSNWTSGSGGEWRDWFIEDGVFSSVLGTSPDCTLLNNTDVSQLDIRIFPNPASESITLKSKIEIDSVIIIDLYGHTMPLKLQSDYTISLRHLSSGVYFLKAKGVFGEAVFRMIKE